MFAATTYIKCMLLCIVWYSTTLRQGSITLLLSILLLLVLHPVHVSEYFYAVAFIMASVSQKRHEEYIESVLWDEVVFSNYDIQDSMGSLIPERQCTNEEEAYNNECMGQAIIMGVIENPGYIMLQMTGINAPIMKILINEDYNWAQEVVQSICTAIIEVGYSDGVVKKDQVVFDNAISAEFVNPLNKGGRRKNPENVFAVCYQHQNHVDGDNDDNMNSKIDSAVDNCIEYGDSDIGVVINKSITTDFADGSDNVNKINKYTSYNKVGHYTLIHIKNYGRHVSVYDSDVELVEESLMEEELALIKALMNKYYRGFKKRKFTVHYSYGNLREHQILEPKEVNVIIRSLPGQGKYGGFRCGALVCAQFDFLLAKVVGKHIENYTIQNVRWDLLCNFSQDILHLYNLRRLRLTFNETKEDKLLYHNRYLSRSFMKLSTVDKDEAVKWSCFNSCIYKNKDKKNNIIGDSFLVYPCCHKQIHLMCCTDLSCTTFTTCPCCGDINSKFAYALCDAKVVEFVELRDQNNIEEFIKMINTERNDSSGDSKPKAKDNVNEEQNCASVIEHAVNVENVHAMNVDDDTSANVDTEQTVKTIVVDGLVAEGNATLDDNSETELGSSFASLPSKLFKNALTPLVKKTLSTRVTDIEVIADGVVGNSFVDKNLNSSLTLESEATVNVDKMDNQDTGCLDKVRKSKRSKLFAICTKEIISDGGSRYPSRRKVCKLNDNTDNNIEDSNKTKKNNKVRDNSIKNNKDKNNQNKDKTERVINSKRGNKYVNNSFIVSSSNQGKDNTVEDYNLNDEPGSDNNVTGGDQGNNAGDTSDAETIEDSLDAIVSNESGPNNNANENVGQVIVNDSRFANSNANEISTKVDKRFKILSTWKHRTICSDRFIPPRNDASDLSIAVDKCVKQFRYPKSLYLTEADEPFCFYFGSMLFSALTEDLTTQLCKDMRRIFARPDQLTLTCPFGCGRHFANMQSLNAHTETRSVVKHCNCLTVNENKDEITEEGFYAISSVMSSAYFVRESACALLSRTPELPNNEKANIIDPEAGPRPAGKQAKHLNSDGVYESNIEINMIEKPPGNNKSFWNIVAQKHKWFSVTGAGHRRKGDSWLLTELVLFSFIKPYSKWPQNVREMVTIERENRKIEINN